MFSLSANFNELSRDKIDQEALSLLMYYKDKKGRSAIKNGGYSIDIERVSDFILDEVGFEYFRVMKDEPDYKEHFYGQIGFRANGYTNHDTKKIYIADQKYNLTPNHALAHELKHALADHDRKLNSTIEPITKEEEDIMEWKAHDFARSLLLPKKYFERVFGNFHDIFEGDLNKMMPNLVTGFEAPGKTILVRACELEMISKSDYKKFENNVYLPIKFN